MNKDRLQMYESLTKITIVLCWLSLFSFWSIKLFGGNWFEIMVHNENFIKFSNTVQNTWLKYALNFITIFVARYFIFCAVCQKSTFKGKELFLIISIIISAWFFVNFGRIELIQMSYLYIVVIIIGAIYQKGWKKLFGIISIVFELLFTTISMLVRNIPVSVLNDYFIAIILSIDFYIMVILYYLYSNLLRLKKEK